MSTMAEKDMENVIHEDIIKDYEDQNVKEEVTEIIKSYKSGMIYYFPRDFDIFQGFNIFL